MGKNPQVKVEISAADKASAIISNVQREFANLGQSIAGLGTAMSIIGPGLAGGGLIGLAAGIGAIAEATANADIALGHTAESTGMSVAALHALRLVSSETGESFESLGTALARLGKNIAEGIDMPSSLAGKVLRAMGVNLRNLKLEDVDSRIQSVTRAIYGLSDAGDRQLAMSTLLGRGWTANAETFKRVAEDGLAPLIKSAEDLEGHIGPKQVAEAKAYQKSWADLETQFAGVKREIGEGLIPELTDLMRLLQGKGLSTNGTVFSEMSEMRAQAAELRREQQRSNETAASMGKNDPFRAKIIANANAYGKEAAAIEHFIEVQNRAYEQWKQQSNVPQKPSINLSGKLGGDHKAKAPKEGTYAEDAQAKAVNTLIAGLLRESATFGMTAEQIKLYDLASHGASDTDMAMAKTLLDKVAAMKESAKSVKDAQAATDAYDASLQEFAISVHDDLATPADAAAAEMDKLNAAMKAGYLTMKDVQALQDKKDLERLKTDTDNLVVSTGKWDDISKQVGADLESSLAQIVTTGRGFSQLLGTIIEQLIEAILKATVFDQIANATSGASGIGGFINTMFGGGRASGGDVEGDTPYLVGEAGPELFIPQGSGRIVPNTALGTGGNTFVYQIDARGADAFADKRMLLALQMTQKSAVIQAAHDAREAQLRRA